jgi:hypothetical protein
MMPDGLKYVGSWIEATFDRRFQVMECDDVRLLHKWADHWRDFMDFEFVAALTPDAVRENAFSDPRG